MANRKDLKNIAQGLAGTFISRNNDVDGYWGIGVLCLHAKKSHNPAIRINLWPVELTPDHALLAKLSLTYRERLRGLLDRQSIPESWISAVLLELRFSTENASASPHHRGKPFSLRVFIKDDLDKTHEITQRSFCEPHNPRKEAKSTRV